MPVAVIDTSAGPRLLVHDLGVHTADRVMAEDDDHLLPVTRPLQLALQPLELRIVDVPAR
jgi:hypothetical protein